MKFENEERLVTAIEKLTAALTKALEVYAHPAREMPRRFVVADASTFRERMNRIDRRYTTGEPT